MTARRKVVIGTDVFVLALVVLQALHYPRPAPLAVHQVIIQATDDAGGQMLPLALTVEFPPDPHDMRMWMPEVVPQGSDHMRLRWTDAASHTIRVGSPGHQDKTLTLGEKSAGAMMVRLTKNAATTASSDGH